MTIQEILLAHRPSRWRSFTNENEILRCCGKDFGNATKKAKRGDEHLAWTEFSAHVAEVLDKHMQEREAEAWDRLVDYAPFTVFERVRLRCENPFREEPNDG